MEFQQDLACASPFAPSKQSTPPFTPDFGLSLRSKAIKKPSGQACGCKRLIPFQPPMLRNTEFRAGFGFYKNNSEASSTFAPIFPTLGGLKPA